MGGAYHPAAKCFTDGLVSQANAEHRYLPGEVADQIDADARLVWSTRSGRHHDVVGTHGFNLFYCDLIIPAHLNFGSQFSNVLDQVVSEGIVVIENENQGVLLPYQLTPNAHCQEYNSP